MKIRESKTSDWCTSFPDRVRGIYDWSVCCHIHDDEYADPLIARWTADANLFKCVRKHSNLLNAVTMFLGVRACGWMFKTYQPYNSKWENIKYLND